MIKFEGLKGKRPLNFDRKKVSVPTSKNLDMGKEKGKKSKDDDVNKDKKKKRAPQSWFGVMQDGQGTANLIQDADGGIAGTVTSGDDGLIYTFNTVSDGGSGAPYVRVVATEAKDYKEEEDAIEGGGGGNERMLLTGGKNLRGGGGALPLPPPASGRKLQSSTCGNIPGWHDSDGSYYDCDWYSSGTTFCSAYGSGYAFGGYTANQACCACGGGEQCLDRPGWFGDWYDARGPAYTCDWYAASPSSRCDGNNGNFGYTAQDACCACGGGGEGTVDVMVVYTAASRAAEGGTAAIERLIALSVQQTNVAFENSAVSARLRLVDTVEDPSYNEAGRGLGTVLSHLTFEGDGVLEYDSRRTAKGADVVVLITNVGTGIAWVGGRGFAVASRQYAASYFTFAHEVGHVLVSSCWRTFSMGFQLVT